MDNRTIEQVRNNEDRLIDKNMRLEQEIQRLKEENNRLKHLPKQIKEYILSEMYVDREVVAGWLQFGRYIGMETYKAINKQVEELGWNNE